MVADPREDELIQALVGAAAQIERLTDLVARGERAFVPELVETRRERARILLALTRWDEALADQEGVITLLGDAVARGDEELRGQLLAARDNRSNTLSRLGRFDEALAEKDEVIAELAGLTHGDGVAESEASLAIAHHNRSTVLIDLGRLEDAVADHAASIAVGRRVVVEYGVGGFLAFVADAHRMRATTLERLGRRREALDDHAAAGGLLFELDRPDDALVEERVVLEGRQRIAEESGDAADRGAAAAARASLAVTLFRLGRHDEALTTGDEAISTLALLAAASAAAAGDLLRARTNRVVMRRGLGQLEAALAESETLIAETAGSASAAEPAEAIRERTLLTARALRAGILLEIERPSDAVKEYDQLLTGLTALPEPRGPAARLVLLSAGLRRALALHALGEEEVALAAVNALLSEHVGTATVEMLGDLVGLHDLGGRIHATLGEGEAAIEQFTHALGYGETLLAAGRISDLATLLATREARAAAFADVGRARDALVDVTAVVEGYRLLADQGPDFRRALSAALRRRGTLLTGLGRVTEAAADLALAERLAPLG